MSQAVLKSISCAAVLGLLAGCGGGGEGNEKVVARAGDVVLTLSDFQEAYTRITPNYRPDISSIEGRRSFANDLLNREILLAEGRRMSGASDPVIAKAVEYKQTQKMLEVLYRQEIESKVDVVGKDVADVYEKRRVNVKGSHILLEDLETARKVYTDLKAGKISFEDAARRYSMDNGTKDRGGAMDEIYWSMNLPDFQLALWNMEPGEISEPFDGTIGVHILRLDERIPKELPTLEEARPTLRSDVRKQMEAVRMKEYTALLEQKAGLTWNEDGLTALLGLIDELSTVDIDTIPVADQHIPAATEEQKKIVLASFAGRDWTIADYQEGLRQLPAANRPPKRLPRKGLRELIRSTQIRQELLRQEAFNLGLDKTDEIVQDRERHLEMLLVEQVHFRFLQAADVPEEDVRAVYDSTARENPDALLVPERVDMVILVHTDSAVVAKGLQRIRSGEDEAQVVKELSLDGRTASKGGRTGLLARGNYSPQIEDAAFSADPSDGWSDPIVTQSGTGAFRLITHEEPRAATYEEVHDTLVQALARNRGETAFEDWLGNERDSRGVEIYDEVLELIGQSVS